MRAVAGGESTGLLDPRVHRSPVPQKPRPQRADKAKYTLILRPWIATLICGKFHVLQETYSGHEAIGSSYVVPD